jgi:hypothetical protein
MVGRFEYGFFIKALETYEAKRTDEHLYYFSYFYLFPSHFFLFLFSFFFIFFLLFFSSHHNIFFIFHFFSFAPRNFSNIILT